MSDIDGLYDKDPHTDPSARLIPEVTEITEDIRRLAGGTGTSLGTGGMITKINAAQIACENGIDLIIVNGREPENLYKIFDGIPVGTRFKAKK
jgi:glutamate 5-kinase